MSFDFTLPWEMKSFCAGQNHVQICKVAELESFSPKLLKIILKYGCAFDDYWFYWLNKKGTYVKRTLVFLPKSIKAEKHRKYEPNKKLIEYAESL